MAETWNDCKSLAIDELRDRWTNYRDEIERDDGDVIHEIAGDGVPVYNADRMSVASHPEVWGCEPDPGLFGDDASLMDIVAVYIYEALSQALYAELETLREQEDEDED